MSNISMERLQEIEAEREKTFSNPNFQNWFRELNVSRLNVVTDYRAKEMNSQYNFSNPSSQSKLISYLKLLF